MKTLIIFALSFSSMFLRISDVTETVLDSTWKTVCETKLDGYMDFYVGIQNLGDNAASDCQVQTWDGDSWEPAGTSIPGCASLAAGAEVLWPRTTMAPNNRLRVQMKSASGTTVGCALYRRR